ncbi:Uncharacterised protein [Mycobacterium tuberculosis]|nr:Uncharacterised protein [Mycobacterium tuberculosis]
MTNPERCPFQVPPCSTMVTFSAEGRSIQVTPIPVSSTQSVPPAPGLERIAFSDCRLRICSPLGALPSPRWNCA